MICPATPSAKPNFAKIRNAKVRRCFKYLRSSYLSSKEGGPLGTSAGRVRSGFPLGKSSGLDFSIESSVADGAILLSESMKILNIDVQRGNCYKALVLQSCS